MRFFLLLLLTLCTFSFAHAAEITFPELTGRVIDEAAILDEGAKKQLEQKLADHERDTSNQIVVVTLKSLQGQVIEEYGYRLGRHWKIGQAERDNGALLIVVPSERQVRIDVGYGLEPVLTDAATRFIIERSILPRFRANDYAGGISAGVDAMMAASAGEFESLPQTNDPQEENMLSGGWLFFIILLLWTMRRKGRGRYSSGLFLLPLILGSGGGSRGSRGGISFGGGGGSFGGGGASGRW